MALRDKYNPAVPTGEHTIVDLLKSLSDLQLGLDRDFVLLTDAGVFNNWTTTPELLSVGGPVKVVYSPGDHLVIRVVRGEAGGDNIGELLGGITFYTVPTW